MDWGLYHTVFGHRYILGVDMMDRLEILFKITELEDSHCANCLRKAEFRRQDHNRLTHLCITQCEIGKQIRELGKRLEGDAQQIKYSSEPFITKEKLTELSKTMFNYEIANKYGVSKQTVSKYIKEWGIEAYGTRKKKKVV